MARQLILTATAGLALVTLAGCIEREESITVAADGSVTVVHVFRGDLRDLKGGAAAVPAAGFDVKSYRSKRPGPRGEIYAKLEKLGHPEVDRLLPEIARVLKSSGGKAAFENPALAELKMVDDPAVKRLLPELWRALKQPAGAPSPEWVYEARARYGSVSEMPVSFAPEGKPGTAQALRWRDRVETRREGDRSIHVFSRTYEPRRWGRYAYGERRWVADLVPHLRKWTALSADRKLEVTRSLLAWERFKHEEFVAAALRKVAPDHPARVPARLEVRDALAAGSPDAEKLLGLLELPDEKLKSKAGKILADLEAAALVAAARTLTLDDDATVRLKGAYRAMKRDFEVTDDLNDETFVIRLTLPGDVIRHNGDGLAGRTVTWRFRGEDLHDRRHELAAVWETE